MIILYSQPNCPQCKMVHRLLDQKQIEYSEISDIDEMLKAGINHTPTIVVDGEKLTGKPMMDHINGLVK